MPPEYSRYHPGTDEFYRTRGGRLFSNRIAHYCKNNCADGIKARLDKYYDYFMIDEVQDLAGHDLDLMLHIMPDTCNTLCVGDFYQHTYDTSLDGNVKKGAYKNLRPFKKMWKDAGAVVDEKTLSKTRRCGAEVCKFVERLGIAIESSGETLGEVRFIEDEAECDSIIENEGIPKLFIKDSKKYACTGMNWGASKGLDCFKDVCVVLYKGAMDYYRQDKLSDLNPQTRNKLYVACTRAHRHLYLMSYQRLEKHKKK